MVSQADCNLSRVARGKLRKTKILLREASVRYMNMPKKTRKLRI
jgi:hypothetical protein